MKAFELPPMLSGTAEEQIDQLREYLMRLALNTEEEQTPAPVVSTQPEKPSSHGTSFGKAQLAKIYPVGSIYISVNEANPGTLFGGTWEQIKDMFLLAAGDIYAAGDAGGEAEHTLTVEEMPSHAHYLNYYSGSVSDYLGGSSADYGIANSSSVTGKYSGAIAATGGSQPHNNMPPYLAVYVWQRVS